MKTKKQKLPRTRNYREYYTQAAAKMGCGVVVAAVIVELSTFVAVTAGFYLLNILWLTSEVSNPLISAIWSAAWLTVVLFICNHFLVFERIDRWSWKSKKKKSQQE